MAVTATAENTAVRSEVVRRRRNAVLVRLDTNFIAAEKARDRPAEAMDGRHTGWRSAGVSRGGTGNLPHTARIAAVRDITAMQPTTEAVTRTTTSRFTTVEAGRIAGTPPSIVRTAVIAMPGTATGDTGIPVSRPAGMAVAIRTIRGTLDDLNGVPVLHKPRRVREKVDGRR